MANDKVFLKIMTLIFDLTLDTKGEVLLQGIHMRYMKTYNSKVKANVKVFRRHTDRQTNKKTDKQTGQKLQVIHLPVWRYKMKYFVVFWGATL